MESASMATWLIQHPDLRMSLVNARDQQHLFELLDAHGVKNGKAHVYTGPMWMTFGLPKSKKSSTRPVTLTAEQLDILATPHDIKLVWSSDHEPLYVHSQMMTQFSDYFDALISRWSPNKSATAVTEIVMSAASSYEDLRCLVRFVYSGGDFHVVKQNGLLQTWVLSLEYQVGALQRTCESEIIDFLTECRQHESRNEAEVRMVNPLRSGQERVDLAGAVVQVLLAADGAGYSAPTGERFSAPTGEIQDAILRLAANDPFADMYDSVGGTGWWRKRLACLAAPEGQRRGSMIDVAAAAHRMGLPCLAEAAVDTILKAAICSEIVVVLLLGGEESRALATFFETCDVDELLAAIFRWTTAAEHPPQALDSVPSQMTSAGLTLEVLRAAKDRSKATLGDGGHGDLLNACEQAKLNRLLCTSVREAYLAVIPPQFAACSTPPPELLHLASIPKLLGVGGRDSLYEHGKQQAECVRLLFSFGARVDFVDSHGNTPLHIATKRRASPGVIRALLDAGVDPNAYNEDGMTAYDLYLHRRANHVDEDPESREELESYGMIDVAMDVEIASRNLRGLRERKCVDLRTRFDAHALLSETPLVVTPEDVSEDMMAQMIHDALPNVHSALYCDLPDEPDEHYDDRDADEITPMFPYRNEQIGRLWRRRSCFDDGESSGESDGVAFADSRRARRKSHDTVEFARSQQRSVLQGLVEEIQNELEGRHDGGMMEINFVERRIG